MLILLEIFHYASLATFTTHNFTESVAQYYYTQVTMQPLSFKSELKLTYQLWLTPFYESLGGFLLLCYLDAEAVFLF